MNKVLLGFLLLVIIVNITVRGENTDCEDHPLISRYPGAVIEYCDTKNFNEFAIAIGPETGYRKIDDWLNVSGKQTRIYYSISGNKQVAEVYQNYLTALQDGDFELLVNKMHQDRNVSKDVGGNTWLNTLYISNPFPSNAGIKINAGSGSMGGTFYIAAQKNGIYVVLSGKRYSNSETVVLLDVLETKEMEDNLITLNADFIAERIFSEGKVLLQNIQFDHNKATIKTESVPLLGEIALFLNKHPNVVIFVVGHTDMTGDVNFNMELSLKRATAVATYLSNEHGIATGRLLPHGVGPLAPVDNNSTDSGKSKNRRVELVLKSN